MSKKKPNVPLRIAIVLFIFPTLFIAINTLWKPLVMLAAMVFAPFASVLAFVGTIASLVSAYMLSRGMYRKFTAEPESEETPDGQTSASHTN